MRRYSIARGLCHERNTASRAPRSCSSGSCGKSRLLFVLDDLLVARRRPRAAPASSRSVSSLTPCARLDGLELVLERVLRNLEHDVAEHLDEAAVAVVREAAVARARLEPLDGLVVQPEVQDRVHHAGHRELGAGADRHEQRILDVAELRAGRLLELRQVGEHLALDAGGQLPALLGNRACRPPSRS